MHNLRRVISPPNRLIDLLRSAPHTQQHPKSTSSALIAERLKVLKVFFGFCFCAIFHLFFFLSFKQPSRDEKQFLFWVKKRRRSVGESVSAHLQMRQMQTYTAEKQRPILDNALSNLVSSTGIENSLKLDTELLNWLFRLSILVSSCLPSFLHNTCYKFYFSINLS